MRAIWPLAALTLVFLAVLALRGVRWAYVVFIALGLAYFPARVGFRLDPHTCQLALSAGLAAASLANHAHIVLFALFFVMSLSQFGGPRVPYRSTLGRAALATLAMGALVELAQAVTGNGTCRLRDLVPDSVGIALGATAAILWRRVRAQREQLPLSSA